MYKQIKGMFSAEEAADELVRHATIIAEGIKHNNSIPFHLQAHCIESLMILLHQYVSQEEKDKVIAK